MAIYTKLVGACSVYQAMKYNVKMPQLICFEGVVCMLDLDYSISILPRSPARKLSETMMLLYGCLCSGEICLSSQLLLSIDLSFFNIPLHSSCHDESLSSKQRSNQNECHFTPSKAALFILNCWSRHIQRHFYSKKLSHRSTCRFHRIFVQVTSYGVHTL